SVPRELAFVLSLVAALAVCIAMTGNLGANGTDRLRLSFFGMPRLYLQRYVMLVADRAAALILGPDALTTVRAAGIGAVAGVALAVFTALVTGSLQARARNLPALLAALYLYFASLALTAFARLFWLLIPFHQ